MIVYEGDARVNYHFIEIEVTIIINLGNIFMKIALVSLGINYSRNVTNDNLVEIIGKFNSLKSYV